MPTTLQFDNISVKTTTMKGLGYHGPGYKAWQDVPMPSIQQDTDAIVRVDATTICGTDLHVLKGDVPTVTDGRILGQEAVGTVEQVGDGVKTLRVGDGILVSCVSSCGACRFCREGRYGQCLEGGGWILSNTIDGTQAEFVRIPFADASTYPAPASVQDEELLMLSDILPTGYEVGVLNGVVRPGDVVAVVGAGPIGLAAIMGARLFSPSHIVAIDLADTRLESAKLFGADIVVNNSTQDAATIIAELTGGLGADVTIEAVGIPETFEQAVSLARPGGHIANIGVHGKAVTLHLEELWSRDVTITTMRVGHFDDPDVAAVAAQRAARCDAVRHPPLHARRDDGGAWPCPLAGVRSAHGGWRRRLGLDPRRRGQDRADHAGLASISSGARGHLIGIGVMRTRTVPPSKRISFSASDAASSKL
jgi:alcohol dehydrogenase